MKFEERIADLETIVEKLEHAELPLEDALGLFEKGVGLVRELSQELESVERRLEVLVRTPSGELETREIEERGR